MRAIPIGLPLESGGTGILLSTTCTTGWLDWFHGELWLFPDGLLRVPIGWARSLLLVGYVRNIGLPSWRQIDASAREWMLAQPGALWIPAVTLSQAELRHTVGADEFRAIRADGSYVQLLWLPNWGVWEAVAWQLGKWPWARARIQA